MQPTKKSVSLAPVRISKDHLETINKELNRLYSLVATATEPDTKKWCKDRIERIQESLLNFSAIQGSGADTQS